MNNNYQSWKKKIINRSRVLRKKNERKRSQLTIFLLKLYVTKCKKFIVQFCKLNKKNNNE